MIKKKPKRDAVLYSQVGKLDDLTDEELRSLPKETLRKRMKEIGNERKQIKMKKQEIQLRRQKNKQKLKEIEWREKEGMGQEYGATAIAKANRKKKDRSYYI